MTNPSSTNPAKFKLKDPFAEREAGKYERPIPSRELILEMMKEQARPLNLDEVAAALGETRGIRGDVHEEGGEDRARASGDLGGSLGGRLNGMVS